jgi:TM2 domain-containing membrane protein YozV
VIGVIKEFDPETQCGLITNGKEEFKFEIQNWIANAPPEQGDQVKFDLRGVMPFNINLYAATLDKSEAVKRKSIAVILALLLGFVGAHRFYLGYYRMGFIIIVVNTLLVKVIGAPQFAILWGLIESVLLLSGNIEKDAQGRALK